VGCYKRSDTGEVNLTRVKRALYPENITIQDSLVQYVDGLGILNSILPQNIKDTEEQTIDISEYSVQKIINLLNAEDRSNFMYRDSDGGIINFERMNPSHCDLCDRVHEKDNTLYITINKNKCCYKRCRKSDKSEYIGKFIN